MDLINELAERYVADYGVSADVDAVRELLGSSSSLVLSAVVGALPTMRDELSASGKQTIAQALRIAAMNIDDDDLIEALQDASASL